MLKTKPFYNFKAVSDTETDLFIYGVIGSDWFDEGNTAKQFVKDFKAAEEKYKRINIRINSPGGVVSEGLPMFNAIAQSKAEVHTYNDGIAYSMGAIILLAAPKGNVHAAKNSLVLLHAPLSCSCGNARDLRTVANELDTYAEVLISAVADKTGKKTEDVKKQWFNYDDHLITSEDAKKEGLVDDLIEANGKVPENISNLSYNQVMNMYSNGFAEDSIIERITSSVRNIFQEFSPKNLVTNTVTEMKKKFLNLSRFFATDIESVNGKLELTDEILDKMDALVTAKETSDAAVTTANTARDAAIAERDTANQTVAARDTRIIELEAEVARLQAAPGASSAAAVVKTDISTEDSIENEYTMDMPMEERVAKLLKSKSVK